MDSTSRAFWETQAATFDDEPDHGLADGRIRDAWRQLLLAHLSPAPCDVVDLGCGTGTLSILLAREGYRVRGLDFAEAMVGAATAKAARARASGESLEVAFDRGDASAPPYDEGSCDVVLSRHVLWAMPDPDRTLAAWIALLRPGGRLVLVEGRWCTGAGLTASACERLLRRHREDLTTTLLPEPVYWGGEITDERYLMVSTG